MRTIFESCSPRPEVLSGELREELFAARLRDVIERTADPVYRDADQFFANTYLTDGLRTLVREALGRLSGAQPASSPFIRLETSFGGGKTHNLIALYHLASGAQPPPGLLDPSWLPAEPVLIAGLVGSDMDASNGIRHGTVTTRTLWGEIAYQLGGEAAYRLVERSDAELVAPGTQWLEAVVGGRPALIMLDELARYLVAARAVPTANRRSDLAKQTVAFLLSLIEFAVAKERVVLVITLAEAGDAFGDETEQLRSELDDAYKVAARQERVITPAGEPELARIVAHRLFARIDRQAARAAAAAYARALAGFDEQGVELPQRAVRAEYTAEIEAAYPFHPELLNTLNRKTATIPNFQRTRGALRLLALAVRRLWQQRPPGTHLIHVHHIDLGVEEILNELTSRLQRPRFRSVVEADIISHQAGSPANCQELDELFVQAGKPPYAQRAATTIFLHSLTQGTAAGVEPAELLLALLGPGDDPELAQKALVRMLGEEKWLPGTACWFLHFSGQRYVFKTEPSLEKVIQDEAGQVGRLKAKEELDRRIRGLWPKGTFEPCLFPVEASDVGDDAGRPKLAVLHYDAATARADTHVPELVEKLYTHAGATQAYRTYKNNVLFLVADAGQVEHMVGLTRRHLAITRIASDHDRLADFSEEQRKQLARLREAAELEVRVAITRAYRHLYYPSMDVPGPLTLAHQVLPAQDQGEVEKDQTAVLLRALKQLEKVRDSDDEQMAPAYVHSKAWPAKQPSITTGDLLREFAKRPGLPILLDPNQLKRTIKTGVGNGTWVYYDTAEGIGYDAGSPPPHVQLSDDAVLYTPGEAARAGFPIKGREVARPPAEDPCPLCGQLPCACQVPERRATTAAGQGPPSQAFQRVADALHDAKAARIGKLRIRCSGSGSAAIHNARSLALAIPQLGIRDLRVELDLATQVGQSPGRETLTLAYQGGWDRYRRLTSVVETFGREATEATVDLRLHAAFKEGLEVAGEEFQAIRELLTALELGSIEVTAEAEEPAG